MTERIVVGKIRAPVAVFVYNRPEHTRRMLLSLKQCPALQQSPLYVFCDGAKTKQASERIKHVRRIVHELVGEQAVIIESRKNNGLAASIIAGVTRLCDEYGRAIVVEDDLVVAEGFLDYMNAALDFYADCEQVMQVSAYMFDVPEFKGLKEAMFLPFTTSWGWGTWKRAWDCFDALAQDWEVLAHDRNLRWQFNLDGSYDYYAMLRRQMRAESDSWAIRWYWSVFRQKGLVLYPPHSYVRNTGFDNSGMHGGRYAGAIQEAHDLATMTPDLPETITVDQQRFKLVCDSIRKLNANKFMKLVAILGAKWRRT